MRASVARERLMSSLATFFGVVAGLLAAVGLYGVLSYTVTRRTNEIGIRVALGAQYGEVMRLVLRQALALTVLGMVIGLAGAAWLGRYLGGTLYGVTPFDLRNTQRRVSSS